MIAAVGTEQRRRPLGVSLQEKDRRVLGPELRVTEHLGASQPEHDDKCRAGQPDHGDRSIPLAQTNTPRLLDTEVGLVPGEFRQSGRAGVHSQNGREPKDRAEGAANPTHGRLPVMTTEPIRPAIGSRSARFGSAFARDEKCLAGARMLPSATASRCGRANRRKAARQQRHRRRNTSDSRNRRDCSLALGGGVRDASSSI